MLKNIINKLPGFNCGKCGYPRCDEFASALLNKKNESIDCSILSQERFKENINYINKILNTVPGKDNGIDNIKGLIDAYEGDITLEPLSGEHSCREVLLPMSNPKINVNEIIRYRPLGCPIIHFAKIIEINDSLLSVHITGPCNRLNNNDVEFIDIGPCMIIAFQGKYKGKNIKVGETIRFLPKHCMMQKIHSGVVVNIEDDNVIIEGIDLKVWEPANNNNNNNKTK
jgi:hypothetical protein